MALDGEAEGDARPDSAVEAGRRRVAGRQDHPTPAFEGELGALAFAQHPPGALEGQVLVHHGPELHGLGRRYGE